MCSHDHDPAGPSWRSAITTAAAAVAGAAPGSTGSRAAATPAAYADPPSPALPTSTLALVPGRVALRVVDPQNNFLTERGVARGVVAKSVREHNVVNNTERLFRAAKAPDLTVAISPHFYDPTDHGWRFEGTLERVMHSIGMVDRVGPLDLTGSRARGPTSSSATSPSFMTARRSSPRRTRSTGRRRTTSRCSCASSASTRSSSPGWRRTSASRATCGS